MHSVTNKERKRKVSRSMGSVVRELVGGGFNDKECTKWEVS